MGKGVQDLHRNVKGAYRAHNEARKEYLKRYRESYLEAAVFGGENIQKEKEEEEGGGEKGGDAAVAEVLAQMSEVAGEQTERANKIDGGVSVTPVPVIESPPPPPPSPLSQRARVATTHVYIFHHLSDCGLGHLMGEFMNVYKILDMLGVGSVSICECGTPHKPWHSGKMQPCKDDFRRNKNVVKYGKRSSDIDAFRAKRRNRRYEEFCAH